jgi:hypothetical protein
LKAINQSVAESPEKNFFARNKRLSKDQSKCIETVQKQYGWFCGIRILGYNEDPKIVWEVGQEIHTHTVMRVESLFSLCISEEDKNTLVDAARFLADLNLSTDATSKDQESAKKIANQAEQQKLSPQANQDGNPLPVPRPKPAPPEKSHAQTATEKNKKELKKEIQEAIKELEVEDW